MRNNELVMKPEDTLEMSESVNACMRMYSKLSQEARAASIRRWKRIPKMHLWVHLADHVASKYGNPRFFWT